MSMIITPDRRAMDPNRCAVSGALLDLPIEPGIPVTEEMIAAGKTAARQLGVANGHDQLSVVYRAMAALAPPTYRDDLAQAYCELELRLGDALREVHRIAALEAEIAEWVKNDAKGDKLISELQDRVAVQAMVIKSYKGTVATLQARLAAFTAAPTPEPKSFPAAALKPSKSDPWRLGGG
jgi:uncharacterized coiled-coil protein SlyX